MSCDERSSAEEDQWNPHPRGMDAAEQRPLLQPVRHRNSSSTCSDDAAATGNYFPEDPEYSSIVRAIEIAIESEVYPEIISQGSSGSYFAKKKNGDVVAVFKPRNEEPYAMLNPKWTKWLQKKCCPCCFGRGCLLSNVGYLSEAGASIVDNRLDLGIVPKTKVVWLSAESFNYSALERAEAKTKRQLINRFPQKLGKRLKAGLPPKVGSLQLFVKGYASASQMLRKFEENPLPGTVHEHFQREFEKLVVLDYIIRNTGNTVVSATKGVLSVPVVEWTLCCLSGICFATLTDRGTDNWLIKYDIADFGAIEPSKDAKLVSIEDDAANDADDEEDSGDWSMVRHGAVKISAIDNGLAFPFKHPDEWRAYPYHWAWTPMAQKSFSDEIANHILPKLSDEDSIESLVRELHQVFKCDKHFSPSSFDKQMAVMRGQIANMKRALTERMSPWQLVRLPLLTISVRQHDHAPQDQTFRRRSFIQRFQRKAPLFSCC